MPVIEITSSDQLASLELGPLDRIEVVGTLFAYKGMADGKPEHYKVNKLFGVQLDDLPVWVTTDSELCYRSERPGETGKPVLIGERIKVHVVIEPVTRRGVKNFLLSALSPLATPAEQS